MNLDYISRQLGQLQIVRRLPDVDVQSEQLVNRAIDVISAALKYLAVQIRHSANPLGVLGMHCTISTNIIGNLGTTLVKGDSNRKSVEIGLERAVVEFNQVLQHFGVGMGLATYELVVQSHDVGVRNLDVGVRNLEINTRTLEVVERITLTVSYSLIPGQVSVLTFSSQNSIRTSNLK